MQARGCQIPKSIKPVKWDSSIARGDADLDVAFGQLQARA